MPALTLKLAASAAFDAVKGCLRIVASAPVADRDDEVVDPRTIRLDAYRKNPVVIFVHDQKAWPIAKCETPDGRFTCEVTPDGKLVQEWYFADTQEGRTAATLYRDRVLRGASIGFLSDGLEDVPPDEAERMYGVRKRLKRHIGGELLETSAVPVPSCPGALALGWIDAPAAKRVLARRGVGMMVTKALSGFDLTRQATAPGKIHANRKTPATGRTRGAKTVSTTATTTDTAAATDVTTKDMSTLDDAGGGAVVDAPHPHENVKAGLVAAMHDAVDKRCAGEMTHEEMKAALDDYAADHDKYSGDGEEDEEEGDGDDTDTVEAEDGDGAEKAVGAMIEKAVAPLRDEIATLKADVKDLEDAAALLLSHK